MNIFELEIWDDEAEKVTFYTVRWQDSALSETDKFFNRLEKSHEEEVRQLMVLLLDSIGTDHGAIDVFFRPEDNIAGLPPKGRITVDEILFYYPKFPLRLYALRVNGREDLVVLFNGGVKSANTNQESPDLNMKFLEAKAFGKRIEEALNDKTIFINEATRTLRSFDGSDPIVL